MERTDVTWDDGLEPPKYENGLPSEIHFWAHEGEIYLLRDIDGLAPSLCKWNRGVAIKDVGLDG